MRSVTITQHGERPLTVNKVATMHRMAWANATREMRRDFGWLAMEQAKHVKFAAADIEATPLHRDARSPQDVAACAPAVKAAIDGLVDVGLLPEDDPRYVRSITFRPPCICGEDGLRLVITEAT